MIVVGLTGSIGMGKSTVAKMFAAVGVPVFDSDAVVHSLYDGKIGRTIEAAFPGVVTNGLVDREALAERVVGDEAAMKRLDAIVHPLVQRERDKFLAEARLRGEAIVVLDVPLLFETGGDAHVDRVVVVSAPETVQKARVMGRRGMTEKRFAAILAKQMPDSEKRLRADVVIETGQGIEHAERQVQDLITGLQAG